MLYDEGVCFTVIGSRNSGTDPDARWPAPFPSHHEGYYGADSVGVRDMLVQTLPRLPPPDMALVHLGTNDHASAFGSDTIEALRDIVYLLRQRNPRVVVLIAQIKLGHFKGAVLNARIGRLAGRESTPQSPVIAVDQYAGWNVDPDSPTADTFDGTHPNLQGQRKMAEAWLAAMRPFLARGAGC